MKSGYTLSVGSRWGSYWSSLPLSLLLSALTGIRCEKERELPRRRPFFGTDYRN
jgi:hypothetical protein